MKNELLHIGPLTVYGYGLMIACGVLAAYITIEYRAGKAGLDKEHVFPLFLWSLAGGFLGAKLVFLITEWKYFVRSPIDYLIYFSDGFVVYGGIIVGVLTAYLYCRVNRLSFAKWADLCLPSVALAQGFGRIGCFLAGCCYGKETSSVIGVTFHHSEFAPNNVPLVPTQILSSALNFLHFFLLLAVSRHIKKPGTIAKLYLLFYSIGRFFLEYLRGDSERGFLGPFSTSQVIALAVFAGVIIWTVADESRGQVRDH